MHNFKHRKIINIRDSSSIYLTVRKAQYFKGDKTVIYFLKNIAYIFINDTDGIKIIRALLITLPISIYSDCQFYHLIFVINSINP